MKTVDIISDLHLDFWVGPITSKSYKTLKDFLFRLLPENPSKVLIIAGDIGHYNHQNAEAFKIFREVYDHVCWVHGNHDMYLVTHSMRKKYKNSSQYRLNNLIELSNRIENVHYLDGNYVEIDGVKIGGACGWYDYSYGIENFNYIYTKEMIHNHWKEFMNDWKLIKWEDSTGPVIFNPLKYAEEQNKKFASLVENDCDVFVSHIGPCHGRLEYEYRVLSTSFYYFDGEEYLYNLDESKTWVYGHTHSTYEYQHSMGCNMITNPLGYPMGSRESNNKIRSINIVVD